MESSSGQRELLKSLLLSLTYSPPNAVDALIASIRNNLPPFDVAAILKDNIESLDSQDEECTVPIGELQMVFSTLRMQESSALDGMYTGFSEHERVNEATEGPHTESGNVERADSSSQTKSSQRQSVADQLRLYIINSKLALLVTQKKTRNGTRVCGDSRHKNLTYRTPLRLRRLLIKKKYLQVVEGVGISRFRSSQVREDSKIHMPTSCQRSGYDYMKLHPSFLHKSSKAKAAG